MNTKIKFDKYFVYIVLILIICNLIIDIYVPMIPEITRELHSNVTSIQSTVSIEFFGYATGSLWAGIYQNKFYLKKILYFGIGLVILSSIACALSQNAMSLTVARILQGIGDGVTFTINGVMIIRIYQEEALAKMYSLMGAFVGVMPLISPVVGAYLGHYLGWQADFYFVAVSFVVAMLFATFIPVADNENRDTDTGFVEIIRKYVEPLKFRDFTYLSCASGFGLGGMMIFVALAPYYFQQVHGFSAIQFSLIAAFNAVPLLLASGINFLFIHKLGSPFFIKCGIFICFFSALILLMYPVDVALHGYTLVLPFSVFMFGQFLVQLNTLSLSYSYINDASVKDNAASIQSFIYLVIAAVLGQIASLFLADSAKIFGVIFLLISIILLILISFVRKSASPVI